MRRPKAPAAISSERRVLGRADRCSFALSNHPHGPSGGNSSQARDAIIKSEPHFGFSVVFQRITLGFLGGNLSVNKPLNQTDQAC